MAEHFSFFDPVLQSDGTFDREYNAQQFTNYFKTLVTTGILKGERNSLKLTATGTNMQTRIDTGVAYILGRYYENDSTRDLTHDTESLGVSRIDRVVIRMDLNTEARYVKSFIKKGVPSTNPVPPTLTQTQNIYEISLAQVRVVGGQTFIATDAVIDERGTSVVCPWAGSNILPSFDDNALAEHINNHGIHVTPSDKGNWNAMLRAVTVGGSSEDANNPVASTILTSGIAKGAPDSGYWYIITFTYGGGGTSNIGQIAIAYLNNGSRGSDMRTRYRFGGEWSAWSPSIQELFTSVSNGKSLVANAITQKGVPTSATAEFATMANNIKNIKTGKKFAEGSTYSVTNRPGYAASFIKITGLDFRPSIVIAKAPQFGGNSYFGVYAEFSTVTNNLKIYKGIANTLYDSSASGWDGSSFWLQTDDNGNILYEYEAYE
ncbi:phage structural protein, truncation [Lysinibacillus capsici]|uniref:Phage structural protein, truncation n=1 Tax=Lysinibacillus capsici TaxID=2115968 RepID=A0A2X0XLN9_9BACI|nr:pyocin knob domain-containing protein [Lysinibacillus capsici]SPT98433.1 phage structural protein, truncation [Lysinibacillus capsici]